MYAAYEDYTGPYGGSLISAIDWPETERRAEAFVDRITYDRVKALDSVPEQVKLAVCAVAEVVVSEQRAAEKARETAGIKSFQNDEYSETLSSIHDVKRQFEAEKLEAAGIYLPLSHPLRYAGV